MGKSIRIVLFMLFTIRLLMSQPVSQTSLSEFIVYEATLNRIVDKIGEIKGQTGTYTLYQYYPCIPDFWNTCKRVLASGPVYWRLYENGFDISTSGASVNGRIRLEWSGLSYTTTYTAPVYINYDISRRIISLRVYSITVPIKFLGIRFGYKTFRIPYSIDFPMGGFDLPVNTSTESINHIRGYPANVRISTHNDYIKISLDPKFQSAQLNISAVI